MFNQTNLNFEVCVKITKAAGEALKNESGVAYVLNKKGNPFLRVKKIVTYENKIGFEVLDKTGKNIKDSGVMFSDVVGFPHVGIASFLVCNVMHNSLIKKVV